MLQLSVTRMSWVRVWLDLRLFTTQFFDKVLLDTCKFRECKIKEILTSIWLISAESTQTRTQVIIVTNNCSNINFSIDYLVLTCAANSVSFSTTSIISASLVGAFLSENVTLIKSGLNHRIYFFLCLWGLCGGCNLIPPPPQGVWKSIYFYPLEFKFL